MSIAVIMPAKNAMATLADSIGSVLAISSVSELIIVDDQSVDDTLSIAQRVNDGRVRIIAGEGRGISAAINAGIKAASSKYIARCDADDIYPEDRFVWQKDWLDENLDYGAISGGFRTINFFGEAIADLACDVPAQDVTRKLLSGQPITTFCSWLTRKSILEEIGGAREWFATAEDLDLMFRVASRARVWHEPRVAYLYRLHDASIVHSQPSMQRLFYERSAKNFARERLAGRPDALMQGMLPLPPADAQGQAFSALEQMRGLLVGAAWSAHTAGDSRTARRTIAQALRREPASLTLWKHFLLICFKRVPRSR